MLLYSVKSMNFQITAICCQYDSNQVKNTYDNAEKPR